MTGVHKGELVMTDNTPNGDVDVTKAWRASQGQKSAATRLRIFAAIAWVVAIGGEIAGIVMLRQHKFDHGNMGLLIGILVGIAIFAIAGNLMWKSANKQDPASKADPAKFFFQNQLGAIVTLILDVTKTAGLFALTGMDFNLTAIAALLTLIGYSVNDKVVVYDRMRENLRIYKTMPLRELIDLSINATLARSLYTSATALLSMLPMALAGGTAGDNFAIAMVFGIVVGASSSIFIAAPSLLFHGEGRLRPARAEPSPRLAQPDSLPS